MNNQHRTTMIEKILTDSFQPENILVTDQSHQHIGHAGAKDGRGHFNVNITAEIFIGKSLIERHRLIYQTLSKLMETDIHALQISAKAPND